MFNKFSYNLKKVYKHITSYYNKILKKVNKTQVLDYSEKWMFDNYLNISDVIERLNSNIHKKEILRLTNKNKQELYNLTKKMLEENKYKIKLNKIYKTLNEYQEINNRYFSYTELEFIFDMITYIYLEQLEVISNKLKNWLVIEQNVNKKFNNISIKDFRKVKKFVNKSNKNADYEIYLLNSILKDSKKTNPEFNNNFNELLKNNNWIIKDIIVNVQKEQAKDNLIISTLFNSFEEIAYFKIESFFTNISKTENLLINESVNLYSSVYNQDKYFYRQKIVKLSRKNKQQEFDLVKKLITKADQNNTHIGFLLFKPKNYNLRTYIYVISIVILSAFLTYFLTNATTVYLIPVLFILSLTIITEFTHLFFRLTSKKNHIFKLNFKDKLPDDYHTMVVIPTIIKTKEKMDNMFENLEIYYLSSKMENLFFSLLADCSNETTKTTEFDFELANYGLKKAEELNEKYNKKIFSFVYRNRFYNESEKEYLGFERKRGALLHFNKLLLNKLSEEQKNEYFYCESISEKHLKIKYVITLDCDTKLYLNNAKKLIGAMAHPLNKPILSKDKRKVISGYGIMQPLIGNDIKVTVKSQYSQLYAGFAGLDSYVTGNFEVYHDVFGEGSFTGKGIYDLEVFDQVLSEAFPENLILSHDLLEGNYLRCGFINSVELYDDFPANYFSDAKRRHRWNRGDWQIIGWLKNKIKSKNLVKEKNPLNLLNKTKIFSNLRRSILPISQLSIMIYGMLFTKEPYIYVAISFLPIFLNLIYYIYRNLNFDLKKSIFLKYYSSMLEGFMGLTIRSVIAFLTLPYEVWLYFDSTLRAIYRMLISKKHLLSWVVSEDMEKKVKNTFNSHFNNLLINIILAIALLVITLTLKINIVFNIIISIIWLSSPLILYLLNLPFKKVENKISQIKQDDIKELSTRTWQFFKDNLTEENHYLIPDNYQLNKETKEDVKTSPTNIGLSLISVISAYHLKEITLNETINTLLNIIKSVEQLEKWKGFLYNWYNIKTTKLLFPKVISTVDNGNFIASLYVVSSFAKDNSSDLYYRVNKLIDDTDFKYLFNEEKNVFSEGYDYDKQELLKNDYHDLMSELRLTSYIAISKGDISYRHWFKLAKPIIAYKRNRGIASWYGSLFEYYMPLIFMKRYPHTLLDESYYFALNTHKSYIQKINSNLPFGISESAYNELDDGSFKYEPFGVPYISNSHKKYDSIVISPYSSIMGIELNDELVINNIEKFKKLNMYHKYGLYDSYDYTDKTPVAIYYSHHQAMILASLTNYLNQDVIKNYFHEHKKIKAVEILLKEKINLKISARTVDMKNKQPKAKLEVEVSPIKITNLDSPELSYGILSNGYYSIILNQYGSGFSKYKNLQINRYRNFSYSEYGSFLYIKNLTTNNYWSNFYNPVKTEPKFYEAVFSNDTLKFMREDEGILTKTEVVIPSEDLVEVKKITLYNTTDELVELELTTYSEVIMCRNEEDIAHRTFNALNIVSEFDSETNSIIFNRKSRTKYNTRYYVAHKLFSENNTYVDSYETNRSEFLERHESLENPSKIVNSKPLTNSVGAVIDPIMSIRRKVVVEPSSSKKVYIVTCFGKSKEQVKEMALKYENKDYIEELFPLSSAYNNIAIKYASFTKNQIITFNKLLPYLFNPIVKDQSKHKNLILNKLDKSNLWRFGISGNIPIVVLEIDKITNLHLINNVISLFEYYKSNSLYIDVAIISGEKKTYFNYIASYVKNKLVKMENNNHFENTPGNIKVINKQDIDEKVEKLFLASALFYIDKNTSTFNEFVDKFVFENKIDTIDNKYKSMKLENIDINKKLEFDNGYGGFGNDGTNYTIYNQNTPTPWSNVIANKKVGFIVTNEMGGYSYAYNSREYKLTSWNPDINVDNLSEFITIDKEILKTNQVSHGFGYSEFLTNNKKMEIKTTTFVAEVDAVKIYNLDIKNKLEEKEVEISLSLKMVLGVTEEVDSKYVEAIFDKKNNAIIFKNKYSKAFSHIKIFLTSTEPIVDFKLDKIFKSIIIKVNLKDHYNLAFILGVVEDNNITKYQNIDTVTSELGNVSNYWKEILTPITINTPDKALNYSMNGWLLYQTYASRLLARSGFYQSGGAVGYRDQLQDVLALIYTNPEFAKKQILDSANHQFIEGDVLHWWHKELNFGIRTTFSDDYLWLIFVTLEYLKITGDYGILNIKVSFVEGDKLHQGESERGMEYKYSTETATLMEHIKIMYEKALREFGPRGLSLMGVGDWNDGMSTVGYKGQGESVFVSMFVHHLINCMGYFGDFLEVGFVSWCQEQNIILKENILENTWDGKWFLRAYFDNNETLGSRNNKECQIDLLSQSWAVLTGLANKEQTKSLFKEVKNHLVDEDLKIIKLLTPAFYESRNNPGYIMDYPIGIRENGAQYTHATTWYLAALFKENKIKDAIKYINMISPITRSQTKKDADIYKVEPYVLAADIYSNATQAGRGGWTWYTGSSSWTYKVILENLIGFNLKGDKLFITPKIPDDWSEFSINYKYINTIYEIKVINKNKLNHGKVRMFENGNLLKNDYIELKNDCNTHVIEVYMEEIK